jgi:serine/threonine protein kinase
MALQCSRCGGVEGWSKDAVSCPCGGAWEPAALPKRVLQRFDLTEWLGAGGMGVVYRALDLTLGRDVALKTLPQLSTVAAERLMTEARAMASLSHDDVAVLYEVAQWRGTPLLVMEYLARGTLAGRLRAARVPDGELVALVRRLALALGRVHARGLYHGDVKPSNIGFAGDGTPKLLDFGLARALTASDGADAVSESRPLGGTWAYLPPEVRDGAAPGPRLDLWALGVVLCEGLLGEHPFPRARSREEVVIGRALALSQLRRTHAAVYSHAVDRVLALDPAERPADAATFADLLAALA